MTAMLLKTSFFLLLAALLLMGCAQSAQPSFQGSFPTVYAKSTPTSTAAAPTATPQVTGKSSTQPTGIASPTPAASRIARTFKTAILAFEEGCWANGPYRMDSIDESAFLEKCSEMSAFVRANFCSRNPSFGLRAALTSLHDSAVLARYDSMGDNACENLISGIDSECASLASGSARCANAACNDSYSFALRLNQTAWAYVLDESANSIPSEIPIRSSVFRLLRDAFEVNKKLAGPLLSVSGGASNESARAAVAQQFVSQRWRAACTLQPSLEIVSPCPNCGCNNPANVAAFFAQYYVQIVSCSNPSCAQQPQNPVITLNFSRGDESFCFTAQPLAS